MTLENQVTVVVDRAKAITGHEWMLAEFDAEATK